MSSFLEMQLYFRSEVLAQLSNRTKKLEKKSVSTVYQK